MRSRHLLFSSAFITASLACGANPKPSGELGDDAAIPGDGAVPGPPVTDAGTFVDASPAIEAGNFNALSVTGSDDVWIAADDGVVHVTAATATLALSGTATSYYGIWAYSPTSVWAVGEYPGESTYMGVVQHWDGQTWTDESAQVPGSFYFYGVWGSGPSDVWAVGNVVVSGGLAASIFHNDGSGWKSSLVEGSLQDFSGIWGSGPSDVWATGFGAIYHFDGTSWKLAGPSSTTYSVFGRIWGAGPDDAWATASPPQSPSTSLFHWNGTAWSVGYTPPPSLAVGNVWEASPSDVWVVGALMESDANSATTGTTLHFDGTTWSTVPSGASVNNLNAVGGSSPSNVWVVGDRGTLLHLE